MEPWSGRPGSALMPPRPTFRRVIVADLIAQIEDGRLSPGQKLPKQSDLAETYGCSIEPVKAALDELEIRGYVQGHQGLGTFVVEQPPERPKTDG